MEPRKFMVFDVESVGLHGEGFAVGFVVVDEYGKELDAGRFACSPDTATSPGGREAREWVRKNVPEFKDTGCRTPLGVRRSFWDKYEEWKKQGVVLVGEVCWPVEARFLLQCIEDQHAYRGWNGPYPLIDLASILLADGQDPIQLFDRRPNELPVHDPLADARQSARILIETLRNLDSTRETRRGPVPRGEQPRGGVKARR